MRGRIVKGIGGFYYVHSIESDSVYQCRARGIFKKDGIVPIVGDWVEIEVLADGDGVVDKIHKRANEFIRPAISNVDQLLVVMAFSQPEPNLRIIDRLLVMAEKSQTQGMLVMNKKDLSTPEERDKISDIYKGLYPIFYVNGLTGEGLEPLREALFGNSTALAGPSGVGKSTLLNDLKPQAQAEVGSISRKTSRGKHTTRHVEIYELSPGTFLFDTPGFTNFDIMEAEPDQLQFYYPEMAEFIGNCRFDNCRHIDEPGCAVQEGALQGTIKVSRYDSYKEQMQEILEKEKNRY